MNWNGGYVLVLMLLAACIEPYDPPLDNSDVNFLVVDGFLDASDGTATLSLARTLPVKSVDPKVVETGALVRIEDGSGTFFTLSEAEAGTYTGFVPSASSDQRYRLLIRTKSNREYASDFITIVDTPAIDSVTWSIVSDGVEFAVTTHDPTKNSRHYRWRFLETYEYHANFNSIFVFQGSEIVPRPFGESIFTCWRTNKSTDIIVSSTKHLDASVINKLPVNFIPSGSLKLSVKYSILVEQQALTEEAYNYWVSLEKTTEHLGGLFDPLPSEVSGNIHGISDPGETVIGLFAGGNVQKSRIFLRRGSLPREVAGPFYAGVDCQLDTLMLSELVDFPEDFLLLVDAVYAPGAGIVGYQTTRKSCADCRVYGGTTTRPTFWE